MARVIGDVWPQASGSSSLGVEQTGLHGFGNEIRPFGHIHHNSGILHDPLRGTSGIIRFQKSADTTTVPNGNYFGYSFDGGKNFPLEIGSNSTLSNIGTDLITPFGPMRILASGEAAFLSFDDMLLSAAGSDSNLTIGVTKETTITTGTDLDVVSTNGNMLITTLGTNKQILIHTIDGALFLDAGGAAGNGNLFTFSDNNTDMQSIEAFDITAGTSFDATAQDISLVSNKNDILFLSTQQITLNAFGNSGVFEYRGGPYQTWFIDTFGATTGGPFNDGYWPIAHSGNVKQMIGQSLAGLTRDLGSGLQFQYNFGDEIAVTSRPSLTPRGILIKYPTGARVPKPTDPINIEPGYGIAVSGATTQAGNISSYGIAILAPNALSIRGSGQTAPNMFVGVDYSTNTARIQTSGILVLNATSGIIATGRATFITDGVTSEINLSGLFIPPTAANMITGDIYMMNHSVISGIVEATSTAITKAKALGHGTPVVQTGSGLINLSVGSGIAMFSNAGVQSITLVSQDVNLNTVVQAADQNYTLTTNTGGVTSSGVITVMSPGLYKISYKVLSEKTVGTTPQTVETILVKNNDGVTVFGSVIDTFHFDNAAASKAAGSTVLLLNLDAGDNIRLKVVSTNDGAENCRIANRGATLVIEKIGPKRGTF